jgi:hypothetical protein
MALFFLQTRFVQFAERQEANNVDGTKEGIMIVLGLTDEDLERPTMTEADEVHVHDGKGGWAKVRVGDRVVLFEPGENKSTWNYLGPGPYTIEWLAIWRCGMGFLQLTTPTKGKGKGVNASVMKIAS